MAELSTKPYLIRAIHEWCVDNGYRPYLAVAVDARTVVPQEYVRDGEIVLNVSADACNRLRMGNDLIEFEARFNRIARQISIPVENVTAVYAAETGQGMAFEVELSAEEASPEDGATGHAPAPTAAQAGRPARAARRPMLVEAPQPAPASADAGANAGEPKAGESDPSPPEPPAQGASARPKLTRIK